MDSRTHTNMNLRGESSIEDEDLGSNDYPFDPSQIDIVTQQLSVFNLVERLENDEINLMPEFQRRPDLWRVDVQSRLIESLILGIPLQAFYFDVQMCRRGESTENFTGRRDVWNVVDGLQRLSSIKNFVLGGQRLKGLEYLKALEGKVFDALSPALKRSIRESTVLVYLIKAGTPEDIKFNIFKRVNTGGMPLTQQEIRHALFTGKGTRFVTEIAEMDAFQAVIAFPRNRRMLDREFINRYLAFRILDIEESYKSMDTFLNDALRVLNRLDDSELADLRKTTQDTLSVVGRLFGAHAFCRYRPTDGTWSRSVNKALFEVVMATLSRLSTKERSALVAKGDFEIQFQALFKGDSVTNDGFDWCVEKSTGDRARVLGRHRIFRDFIARQLEGCHD